MRPARTVAALCAASLCACGAGETVGSLDASGPDVVPYRDAGIAPRLISPAWGARWSTATPTLRWSGEATELDLCRDGACASLIARIPVRGESATMPTALPPGVLFWRVTSPGGARSATRMLHVPVARTVMAEGGAVGTITDFDADGLADVAVSAQYADGSTGAAYVYPGARDGLGRWPTVILAGTDWNTDFGVSLASAGDLDGDGYGELAVGAPGVNGSAGAVYVYRGTPHGVEQTPWVVLTPPVTGVLRFGTAVAGAGDVDRDGYADLVVGAPGAQFGVAGHAWVYRFGPGGRAGEPMLLLPTVGVTAAQFGATVTGGCDFDADGFADVAVVSPGASVWIYRGGDAGIRALPSRVLSAPGGGPIYPASVACAGDVNADGYADLVAGASGPEGGRVRVWFGSASGVDASRVVELRGDSNSDQFGASVVGTGDLNADGFDDVLVGSDNERTMTRRAYVFTGTAHGPDAVPTVVYARADRGFGLAVGASGDVDGDGIDDALVCAMDAQMFFGFRGGSTPSSDAAWAVHGPGGGGFGTAVARRFPRGLRHSISLFM